MKVLWVGDAVIQSGFSTVTHNVCDELTKMCDITVFGIGYDGRVRNKLPYYVYPAADKFDLYSFANVPKVIETDGADAVVVFNDLPVVMEYIKHIRQSYPKLAIVPLFPINMLPLDYKMVSVLLHYDIPQVLTYTEFSKKQVNNIIPSIGVEAIYHGVDKKVFTLDADCKKTTGLKDYFVAGYIGSNTSRKRLDLLLEGFSKFAKNKTDVRCLIHTNDITRCYPIPDIADYYGVKDRVILSSGYAPNDKLRMLYSLMDVNVNTSLGEGFGLPLIEGASCGVPVLCPEHGNLVDIWSSGADFIKIAKDEFVPNSNNLGAVIDTDDMAVKLEKLYIDRNYLKTQGTNALNRSNEPLFDWMIVSSKVYSSLVLSTKTRMNIIV